LPLIPCTVLVVQFRANGSHTPGEADAALSGGKKRLRLSSCFSAKMVAAAKDGRRGLPRPLARQTARRARRFNVFPYGVCGRGLRQTGRLPPRRMSAWDSGLVREAGSSCGSGRGRGGVGGRGKAAWRRGSCKRWGGVLTFAGADRAIARRN